MFSFKFFGLALAISTHLLFSQKFLVSEVTHSGNSFTKDYVINREIQHPINAPLDSSIAIQDRNRLINLGIFAEVKWKVVPLEDFSYRLEYQIIENSKFFGGRFIGAALPAYEEDLGWSFGGGGQLRNFRGRNESIGFAFSRGGRNTFGFQFSNPWISGDHVSLDGDLAIMDYSHPFLAYDIQINTVELNIGRYFGDKIKTSIGFELEDWNFIASDSSSKYKYFAPQGFFVYDTRDIYSNPTKGILFRQSFYSRLDLKKENENNFTWFQSIGFYQNLTKTNKSNPLLLAFGFKSKTNFGSKDMRFQSVLGEVNTVRGWSYPSRVDFANEKNSYRFGYHTFITSIELRKVVVPRMPIDDLYEFGFNVAYFIDVGYIGKNDFFDVFGEDPLVGTGISLQFQLPFVSVIRLEYGFGFYKNKLSDKSFHIGISNKI